MPYPTPSSSVPFGAESVILASHTARAIDHAGNANLCVAFAPDDGVQDRYIGTPPGVTRIISKDKDHQHAFVFRLLLREELPEHDPFTSGEVTEFLAGQIKDLFNAKPADAVNRALGIVAELLQGNINAEFLALHEAMRAAGKKEGSADMSKMGGLILAAQRDPDARRFALNHLNDIRAQPSPAASVPLRQRVKQLVIPGPERDVVISPLPSLPMLGVIKEIAQFVGQEAPHALHRFIGWQAGISNPQNTGIPLIGGSKAIRHFFLINASPGGFNIRAGLSQPFCRDALQDLYTAIRYRRFCRDAQGIKDEKTPSPSNDIDRRLSDAARSVVEALDDAVDGIVRAAREDVKLRDLSRDDLTSRLRSAFLTEVGRSLQRIYAAKAKPSEKKKAPQIGMKPAEQAAILQAWDAAWADQQGDLA